MSISTDDLVKFAGILATLAGSVFGLIKLIASEYTKTQDRARQAEGREVASLKEMVTELKTIVGTVAKNQVDSTREMAALKDLIHEARLEMKDHRLETAKATEESKELFRRWLPLVKKMVETQLTQVGPDSVLVSGKKKS